MLNLYNKKVKCYSNIYQEIEIWRCYILYEGSYVHALLTNEYSENVYVSFVNEEDGIYPIPLINSFENHFNTHFTPVEKKFIVVVAFKIIFLSRYSIKLVLHKNSNNKINANFIYLQNKRNFHFINCCFNKKKQQSTQEKKTQASKKQQQ